MLATRMDFLKHQEKMNSPNDGNNQNHQRPTSRLCVENIKLLGRILSELAKCKAETKVFAKYPSLERSCTRLRLWSDEYAVSDGGLDRILIKSRRLAKITQKPLISIGETLIDRLIPLLRSSNVAIAKLDPYVTAVRTTMWGLFDDQSNSSDSSGSDFGVDTFGDVAEDLLTDTMCLIALHPLLMNPIPDVSEDLSAPRALTMDQKLQNTCCNLIRTRFRKADDDLVLRLGKANHERYTRLWSNLHISSPSLSLPIGPTDVDMAIPYGIGEVFSVQIPSLPLEARTGNSFKCMACGVLVSISDSSVWKEHLYADLAPWVCHEMTCPSESRSFKTKNDWISHLAHEHSLGPHWDAIKCPLCCENTGAGRIAITKHLAAHLEEISLAALPMVSDRGADPDESILNHEAMHTKSSVTKEYNDDLNKFQSRQEDDTISQPVVSGAQTEILGDSISPNRIINDVGLSIHGQEMSEVSTANDHKCASCEVSYTSPDELKDHRRSHDKPYTCETCQVGFARARDLWQHGKIYACKTQERGNAFICSGCTTWFTRQDVFDLHISSSPACAVHRQVSLTKDRRQDIVQAIGSSNHESKATLDRSSSYNTKNLPSMISMPIGSQVQASPETYSGTIENLKSPGSIIEVGTSGHSPIEKQAIDRHLNDDEKESIRGAILAAPEKYPTNVGVKTHVSGWFVDGTWYCDCEPPLPAVQLQVCGEGSNKGGWFYICREKQHKGKSSDGNHCNFFLWNSDAKLREEIETPNKFMLEPDGSLLLQGNLGHKQTAPIAHAQISQSRQQHADDGELDKEAEDTASQAETIPENYNAHRVRNVETGDDGMQIYLSSKGPPYDIKDIKSGDRTWLIMGVWDGTTIEKGIRTLRQTQQPNKESSLPTDTDTGSNKMGGSSNEESKDGPQANTEEKKYERDGN